MSRTTQTTSFTTKAELFAHALAANPRLTIDRVPDAVVTMANNMVRARLAEHMITADVSSEDNFVLLEHAAVCYGMEYLNYHGIIRWSTGEITGTQEGPFRTFYQADWLPNRWDVPDKSSFEAIMPHETWRMMGNRFITSFIQARAYDAGGHDVELLHDNTKRGYGARRRYKW